jgi:2-C-methyl-D-erythritol 4-phosphate cytidylyltransferase
MTSAVIVAAGRGKRFGPDQDKLFLEIAGCPVVGHTWRRFDQHPGIDEIVVVVRPSLELAFHDVAKQLKLAKPYRLALGGAERQDSVWNGLEAVSPGMDIVCIHDGARPCTDPGLITACIQAATEHGAAVAAQPMTDTIKESADGRTVAKHLDRSKLWSVQTPQTFRLEVIRRALDEVRRQNLLVTDDTAACELIGQAVHLVASRAPNPKVTIAEDLPFLEVLLRRPTLG